MKILEEGIWGGRGEIKDLSGGERGKNEVQSQWGAKGY